MSTPEADPDANQYGRLGPVLHPLYVRAMPFVKRLQGGTFSFKGTKYPYFAHTYNETWTNERAIEIPIARTQLRGEVLEIGNVLAYYDEHKHTVVDKYEIAPGVHNLDVLDYETDQRFDTILAISTLEHVGFDEDLKDPEKPRRAVEHLATLLAPGGTLMVTAPIGYNPGINAIIEPGARVFDEVNYMRRLSANNRWQEASWAEVKDSRYSEPYFGSNGLVIAFIRKA